MRQNPSRTGPWNAPRGGCRACGVAARPAREEACDGLNPIGDRLGLPRGFVRPASI